MKTTFNTNIQYGNNLYGLSSFRSAFNIQRVTVLPFSLNVIWSTHLLLFVGWNLSISISIWMRIIGNFFTARSLKHGSPCRMSRIRFKSVHFIQWPNLNTSKNFFCDIITLPIYRKYTWKTNYRL